MFDIRHLYKEVETRLSPLRYSSRPPTSSSNTQGLASRFEPQAMSGSSFQGRWTASSITEEDITKLREVRYLTAEILHRLPAPGEDMPTPSSNERVV